MGTTQKDRAGEVYRAVANITGREAYHTIPYGLLNTVLDATNRKCSLCVCIYRLWVVREVGGQRKIMELGVKQICCEGPVCYTQYRKRAAVNIGTPDHNNRPADRRRDRFHSLELLNRRFSRLFVGISATVLMNRIVTRQFCEFLRNSDLGLAIAASLDFVHCSGRSTKTQQSKVL
jgi:hypothetical protein